MFTLQPKDSFIMNFFVVSWLYIVLWVSHLNSPWCWVGYSLNFFFLIWGFIPEFFNTQNNLRYLEVVSSCKSSLIVTNNIGRKEKAIGRTNDLPFDLTTLLLYCKTFGKSKTIKKYRGMPNSACLTLVPEYVCIIAHYKIWSQNSLSNA